MHLNKLLLQIIDNKKYKLLYIIICFYLLSFIDIFAQIPNQIKFKHITANEGLSSNRISYFLKDSKGLIWVGTRNGLNCFNGSKIVVYDQDDFIPGDRSRNIHVIFEDKDSNLWVSCWNGGLYKLDRNTDKFIICGADLNEKKSRIYKKIRAICHKDDSSLWLGSFGYGLSIYNIKSNKRIETDLKAKFIRSVIVDSEGNTWISGNKNIYLNKKDDNKFEVVYDKVKSDVELNFFDPILYEDKNTIWGTTMYGILKIDKKSKLYEDIIVDPKNYPFYVNQIAIEDNNKLWISTSAGLKLYDVNSGYTKTYLNNNFDETSIISNSLNFIYRDELDYIWIGSENNGFSYFNLKSINNQIEHFKKDPVYNSLSDNRVNAVAADEDGNIWIGTATGGLNLLDRKTNKFTQYYTSKSWNSISENNILSFFIDKDGIIWIGTFSKGVDRFDPKTKSFSNIDLSVFSDRNINPEVRKIDDDGNGNLWLATSNGVVKLNKSKLTAEFYNRDTSSFLSNNICHYIGFDTNGKVWVCTRNGLNVSDTANIKFTAYKRDPKNNTSISSSLTTLVYEDGKGRIWIGTKEAGLNLYLPETDNFNVYDVEDGLASNYINGILEDKNGSLWISTNKGITKFIPPNENNTRPVCYNFDVNDGLQGNMFNLNSCCKTVNGEFVFGGDKGLNIFNPTNLTINQDLPRVYLTDFKINNQSVQISTDSIKTPLKKTISETEELRLGFRQNSFSFDFIAINYDNPGKCQYKYMLKGYDKDWINIGEKREAIYTNIDPGVYVFKVIVSNGYNVWNTKGASVLIKIVKPWFKKIWFILPSILVVVSLVIFIYWLRMNIIKEQKTELELKVQVRTKRLEELNKALNEKSHEITTQKEMLQEKNNELEMHRNNLEVRIKERTQEFERAKLKAESSDKLKTFFLANMSHEIRTPMNAIMGFSSLLSEPDIDDRTKAQYIRLINQNGSTLLSLIDDIIDLSKIQAGHLNIKETTFDINRLLNELYIIYIQEAEKVGKSHINIVKTTEKSALLIKSDQLRVKQVLINLLSNALKYTEKGTIEFGYEILDSNTLKFFVKDTGIGIANANIESIFTRFNKIEDSKTKLYRGAGLGLAISKNLVKLFGGKIWAESKIGEGSQFYFTLKVDKIEDSIALSKDFFKYPEYYKTEFNWKDKCVLIAEDEDDNYMFLEKALQKTSIRIVWARDGLEAVNSVKDDDNIDLVLMDIKMPNMNGMDALSSIRLINNDIPIIALTAFAMENDKEKMIEAGFNDYLSKPVEFAKLLSTIDRFI